MKKYHTFNVFKIIDDNPLTTFLYDYPTISAVKNPTTLNSKPSQQALETSAARQGPWISDNMVTGYWDGLRLETYGKMESLTLVGSYDQTDPHLHQSNRYCTYKPNEH